MISLNKCKRPNTTSASDNRVRGYINTPEMNSINTFSYNQPSIVTKLHSKFCQITYNSGWKGIDEDEDEGETTNLQRENTSGGLLTTCSQERREHSLLKRPFHDQSQVVTYLGCITSPLKWPFSEPSRLVTCVGCVSSP